MKKNKMMRIASVLLVAVLLSTCAISGTFAKYIETDRGSDVARVAKWGVNVEVESFNLFAADYKTDDDTATFTGQYSVSSPEGAEGARDDVLAPGTSGTFADISITGTPEVAVDVKVDATVDISDNWMVDTEFYCPIVITVGTTVICGLEYDNVTDFEDAVTEAIVGCSEQYAPNTDLTGIDANFDIGWAWAFDGAGHAELGCECESDAQDDANDTKLGDVAVADDRTISIAIEITVAQIN